MCTKDDTVKSGEADNEEAMNLRWYHVGQVPGEAARASAAASRGQRLHARPLWEGCLHAADVKEPCGELISLVSGQGLRVQHDALRYHA